jgi:hypothetical protein
MTFLDTERISTIITQGGKKVLQLDTEEVDGQRVGKRCNPATSYLPPPPTPVLVRINAPFVAIGP